MLTATSIRIRPFLPIPSPLPPRRLFHTRLSPLHHKHVLPPSSPDQAVHITFIDPDGTRHPLAVAAGDNLLDIAHEHDIELEGACEGSIACSTCHVILPSEYYDKLEAPSDEEDDMLDLAFGLKDTSRLGCQVVVTKELDGMEVQLPSATRNIQSEKLR